MLTPNLRGWPWNPNLTIPTGFVNSLSYLESLYELAKFIQYLKEYLDSEIQRIQDIIDGYEERFNYYDEQILILGNRINQILIDVQNQLAIFEQNNNQKMAALEQRVQQQLLEQNIFVNQQITDLRNYVNSVVKFGSSVFSPVTGIYGPVQWAINDLANFHRISWNCSEYDGKQLTASVYDSLNIPAYSFDFESKQYIA